MKGCSCFVRRAAWTVQIGVSDLCFSQSDHDPLEISSWHEAGGSGQEESLFGVRGIGGRRRRQSLSGSLRQLG